MANQSKWDKERARIRAIMEKEGEDEDIILHELWQVTKRENEEMMNNDPLEPEDW